MRRDDKLHGGEPVAVEDQHDVGPQLVEDLASQVMKARVERALLAVVQFAT